MVSKRTIAQRAKDRLERQREMYCYRRGRGLYWIQFLPLERHNRQAQPFRAIVNSQGESYE